MEREENKTQLPVLSEIDPSTLQRYLTAHSVQKIGGNCVQQLKATGNTFKEPSTGLYCWRGIVRQRPSCTIAETCSPISFTDARTRFCLTFQRYSGKKQALCKPSEFVVDPTDPSPPNRRGGILVRQDIEKCKGAAGFLTCALEGGKQSLGDLKSDPSRRNKALMSVGAVLVALFGLAVLYRRKKGRGKLPFPKIKR